jgi:hypothetical protein
MSTATAARREVHYASLDEFQADVERLTNGKFRTVGNWSFPQILDHLAKTMKCSLDGFGFRAPWFIRAAAPFIKNSFLTKPMKAGFRLPKKMSALLPANNLSLPAAFDNVRNVIARCQSETPQGAHPVFGKLAGQEWTSLHLRHAELHMSFVVPEGSP